MMDTPQAQTIAGAQVVATDISPAMIERLAWRARDERLGNLHARVMDGHALQFGDDAFDFSDVAVEPVVWATPFDSATHLWQVAKASNPIGAQLVGGLTEAQEGDAVRVLDGMLRERSGGSPNALLHTAINVGTGTA
jgi:hypothetical protein